MYKTGPMLPECLGNSVFHELTGDFRATWKACQRVLGEHHILTHACLHASSLPMDRMCARLVWTQFESLPYPKKAELLQALRSRAL